jgi:hypothetical protein
MKVDDVAADRLRRQALSLQDELRNVAALLERLAPSGAVGVLLETQSYSAETRIVVDLKPDAFVQVAEDLDLEVEGWRNSYATGPLASLDPFERTSPDQGLDDARRVLRLSAWHGAVKFRARTPLAFR